MENKQLVERSRQSFTRLARFINQLMREQLFCGPVTVQQCYTLEALIDGPKSMSALAAEVALHQSTLTRIVEKLEKQNLLSRRRKESNQRTVEVQITEAGKQVHVLLEAQKRFYLNNRRLRKGFVKSPHKIAFLKNLLNLSGVMLQSYLMGQLTKKDSEAFSSQQ